ncbi:NUDIX hydrolase [Nonomuraea sp. CA-143628]|uniref:NUDIX hydrolase n=1 Tax=Nonomuraea sp. CA-143628 TaxID=3239997 RepID=UPI003D8A6574
MPINDADIGAALSTYLARYPEEAESLGEPLSMLANGDGFASRRTFPMHVTVGALLTRGGGSEILLVDHRAYGLLLQPGGHLEPTDTTLIGAAMRELLEETGVDAGQIVPASQTPVYVDYGRVPARPDKDEPAHHHLDIGYAFVTMLADVGDIQESEVLGAAWYPLAEAARLVGPYISRAVGQAGPGWLTGAR